MALNGIFSLPTTAQKLNIYNVPWQMMAVNPTLHNDDFTVCVRTPGGEWQSLNEYTVTVDWENGEQEATMVQFDFEGKVEMRVKLNNGRINEAVIRPLARKIKPKIEGNYIYFTLTEPAKLSLEINNDRMHNLHIFANEMEKETYRKDDPNVMYFSGYNHPKNGKDTIYNIPSNTTVYFAPGAVVYGQFACQRVENVRFVGRGLLMHQQRGFVISHSRNIEIDGITIVNCEYYSLTGGQTIGLKINNFKSFTSRHGADGIDLMCCSDVVINDVFMRNSDDCIALYGHRWGFYGDMRNYKITNAILWADVAHPVNIGSHGNISPDSEGETFDNLLFSNIDILEHDEKAAHFQGCLAFTIADKNLAKNIVFDNIRVESIKEGQLFNLRVIYTTMWGRGAPGRGIENIVFKNIYYDGFDEKPSIIEGYDETRQVKNISFENIVINGKRAKTAKDAGLKIGRFTENIKVF
jgi:polygalacturonase